MNFRPLSSLLLTLVFTAITAISCKPGDSNSSESTKGENSTTASRPETLDIGKVSMLEPEKFAKESRKGNSVILDIRQPEEFEKGHIEGATNLNFFTGEFKNQLLALDKDKKYFIYSKAESQSKMAAAFMNFNDFKEVHSLKGGYEAWLSKGLE
ncbi:MAG: rhodanese-like domain-containing protein [Bacteroidota bacterium]|nr:rhodanese-like domain-containing protein [Bacteroidota bacterium]